MNSVADFVPALVLGLITRVATWQLTSLVLVAQCSPPVALPSRDDPYL